MDNLVKSQADLFFKGHTLSYEFRSSQLKKLLTIVKEYESKIYEALYKDLGKPKFEAGVSEVEPVYNEITKYLKNLKNWMKPKPVRSSWILLPSKAKVLPEPLGNTLIISPWNYPFLLALKPLIGAIAAGNTAVIKPSEYCPHIQKVMAEIINNHFEKNYLYLVEGGILESQLLLEQKFDFIFFTGSTAVGKVVMKAASKNLTPVCLELGGKSPCIVDKGVDLKYAAEKICFGKFFNSGQTCVAPDYIYIHERDYEEFIIQVKKRLEMSYPSKNQIPLTTTKIVNKAHYNRIKNLIDPKKIIIGDIDDCDGPALYIPPTVLGKVSWDDSIMGEEIFGPLMPVLVYKDINDVIKIISKKDKPLALYLFSKNKKTQNLITRNLSFGNCCINDCLVQLNISDLPFGGVGNSGMGKYHGQSTFKLFSHFKSIFHTRYIFPAVFVNRPYKEFNFKLIKKILRYL